MTVRPEAHELPRTSYFSMEILRSLRSLRMTGGIGRMTAGVGGMTRSIVIPSAARNLRQAARMRFLDSLRSLGMTKGSSGRSGWRRGEHHTGSAVRALSR
jgi:hypothetical protein